VVPALFMAFLAVGLAATERPRAKFGSTDPNAYPNIYQAVHSMEPGYVVVWYKGLSSQQVDSLGQFGNDFKVIVASYPQLPTGTVGLTAWGRLQTCQKANTAQIAQFIKLYRLKTASEPQAA
jgi:hypothetical protein